MHLIFRAIISVVMIELVLAGPIAGDCFAGCLACWKLKGVVVRLEDGTRIKGYATWNQEWADLRYDFSTKELKDFGQQVLSTRKRFPEVIFDPLAEIEAIAVYTHLRSIKYPVKGAPVATREPVVVKVKDIRDVKLNPGLCDGYNGAGALPLVSRRVADLLRTKPVASCHHDGGSKDVYWVSYDKSFPDAELRSLCDQQESNEEVVKRLKARDIFSLAYDYD